MPKVKPAKCPACSRPADQALRYRRRDRVEWYYRCPCGKEWTTQELGVADVRDPVSADEVLEVHQRLEKDVSVDEMIHDVE